MRKIENFMEEHSDIIAIVCFTITAILWAIVSVLYFTAAEYKLGTMFAIVSVLSVINVGIRVYYLKHKED